MLLLLLHLYIVTMDILPQVMHTGMLTALMLLEMLTNPTSGTVNMDSWRTQLLFLRYSRILTFFFVSDVVSSEVKSRLGAVIRWLKRSMYRKCTRPGNSSRYLLMVREALVIIIKDNTICTGNQAKKAVSLHNYKIPLHCASHSLIWISCDTSYVQYFHFLSQDLTDICMTDGPLLEKELLICVYYTGVLSHSQLLFWDFCFEDMAMDWCHMVNRETDQNHDGYKKIRDQWKEGIWRKGTGFEENSGTWKQRVYERAINPKYKTMKNNMKHH